MQELRFYNARNSTIPRECEDEDSANFDTILSLSTTYTSQLSGAHLRMVVGMPGPFSFLEENQNFIRTL